MRVGDIKVEALKLMFVNYSDDIRLEELPDLGGQEDYRTYLVNMNGAINRCFADLESKHVLPVKVYPLETTEGLASGSSLRFDLSVLLSDFFDVSRLICDAPDGYCGDCEYQREGDTLVLRDFDQSAEYRLLYYPKLPRVTDLSGDHDELPIPEEIAAFIPYFVKGDLYRDDEPNEASEARNWYEAAMEQIKESRANKTSRVVTVYSQVDV